MSKLNFYYGAMMAGKSMECIKVVYNYREQGLEPLILKPSVDTRNTLIESRTGSSVKCINLGLNILPSSILMKNHDVVIVDESQFLTKQQVDDLREIAIDGTPVICFGLKVNFLGELFEGSKRLFELSDTLNEIKGLCKCGSLSGHNVRLDEHGEITFKGDLVKPGYNYAALCQECFHKSIAKK